MTDKLMQAVERVKGGSNRGPRDPAARLDVPPVKFCRACRWLNTDYFDCRSPKNIERNLVTGVPQERASTAGEARNWPHLCGHDAKWFEPKPTNPEAMTDATNSESQGAETEEVAA